MKKTYLINIVIFLCFTPYLFSQSINKQVYVEKYSSSFFDFKEMALNEISATNSSSKNKDLINSSYKSEILIQQIGNYNTSSIDVKSKFTTISVNQTGENNDFVLVKNAEKIKTVIYQNGNSNSINDYSYHSNYEINSQMSQNGNNQNIKSIGSNSISKDMKVNQIGNGTSVIILNKLN